jgi:hypothetical protein
MSLAIERASAGRLEIGKVLQDASNVLGRNLVPFGLLALVLVGVPGAIAEVGKTLSKQDGGYTFLTALGGVVTLVTRPILLGALFHGTVRDLDGERPSMADCLRAGRRRWGTLLGLSIWSGLLIGLGFIFLVVPGVMLAVRWAVAGPLVALGGDGIQGSMERSAELTEGRRWSIFLLYLIVFIAIFGLLFVFGAGSALLLPKLPDAILTGAVSSLASELPLALVAAVLYRQLRGDREGASAATLSEVFA